MLLRSQDEYRCGWMLGLIALALASGSTIVRADSPVAGTPIFPPHQIFGVLPHGMAVTLYTLANDRGMRVCVIDYGATITSIRTPDRTGKIDEVVLGFDRLAPYLKQTAFLGATIGRYANRIAQGKFSIGKQNYKVPINDPPNALHGGPQGFDKQLWKAEAIATDGRAIRFSRLSPDSEMGFPGNLFVSVTYALSDANELAISYQATTDRLTVLNLTNHAYFNLAGAGRGTVLNHLITIHADAITPVDKSLIPTGTLLRVAGTPWDLRTPTPIGRHLKETGGHPAGYDHNFVLKKGFFSRTALAAEVTEPTTGRTLAVTTDQPGLQFYTANFFDGSLLGHNHLRYPQYGAFALETQHYPDSPNRPNFPSTLLSPGDTFTSTTVLAFGVEPTPP